MKLGLLRCFCFSLAIVLTCASLVAQEGRSQEAKENAEAEKGADREEDSRNARRDQLEQALERLNAVIGEAPSRLHHERAGILFQLGRFKEAIQDYDKAARFGQPHDEDSCWERGLAQYYAGEFRAARDQFSRYHRVGPSDIENGLWRFLCIGEEEGIEKAQETMFEYPRSRRKPFNSLLSLFLGQGNADAVLEEAKKESSPAEELTETLFYAHYYLGKYYEIADRKTEALVHVQKALEHRIDHFMFACAEIDARRLSLAVKN